MKARPIRISGRRESGIAACPALVEFDQLFIQMQILDHRTHLEVEPLNIWCVRFFGHCCSSVSQQFNIAANSSGQKSSRTSRSDSASSYSGKRYT